MPAGSPIGSGQGVLNPNNIRIILEDLKGADPSYPVIVDAGVGTASDVSIAMELGCDGVLLNTGIAGAARPAAHGARHAAGGRIGLAGSRRRTHSEKALCDGVEPDTGVLGNERMRELRDTSVRGDLHHVTTVVRPWFKRVQPPTSHVSAIPAQIGLTPEV